MYANNKSIINNLDQNSFNSFFEDYLAELNLFKKNEFYNEKNITALARAIIILRYKE